MNLAYKNIYLRYLELLNIGNWPSSYTEGNKIFNVLPFEYTIDRFCIHCNNVISPIWIGDVTYPISDIIYSAFITYSAFSHRWFIYSNTSRCYYLFSLNMWCRYTLFNRWYNLFILNSKKTVLSLILISVISNSN